MIRIAISEAAFEAVAETLPISSVGFERELDSLAGSCSVRLVRSK